MTTLNDVLEEILQESDSRISQTVMRIAALPDVHRSNIFVHMGYETNGSEYDPVELRDYVDTLDLLDRLPELNAKVLKLSGDPFLILQLLPARLIVDAESKRNTWSDSPFKVIDNPLDMTENNISGLLGYLFSNQIVRVGEDHHGNSYSFTCHTADQTFHCGEFMCIHMDHSVSKKLMG